MSQRMRRVNEAIRQVLAEQLPELKDPRIGFVTLTEVRTTPDLSEARVYFTVLDDSADVRAETAAGLRSAGPLLRRELGAQLRLRRIPALHFVEDPLPAQGRRIEQLLDEERDAGSGKE